LPPGSIHVGNGGRPHRVHTISTPALR
jgi:hypothetical protein